MDDNEDSGMQEVEMESDGEIDKDENQEEGFECDFSAYVLFHEGRTGN